MDHVQGDAGSYAMSTAFENKRNLAVLAERVSVLENFVCEKLGFNKELETVRNREFHTQMKLYEDMEEKIGELRGQYHQVKESMLRVDKTIYKLADVIEKLSDKLGATEPPVEG